MRDELEYFAPATVVAECDHCGADITVGYDCVYNECNDEVFCTIECALDYWDYKIVDGAEVQRNKPDYLQ